MVMAVTPQTEGRSKFPSAQFVRAPVIFQQVSWTKTREEGIFEKERMHTVRPIRVSTVYIRGISRPDVDVICRALSQILEYPEFCFLLGVR